MLEDATSRCGWRSAALAATPLVSTRPETAAMTAAWRPTDPAFDATAAERAVSGLAFWGALWRPSEELVDTLDYLSQRLRGELSDSDGSHPAAAETATSPQGFLERNPKLGSPASAM